MSSIAKSPEKAEVKKSDVDQNDDSQAQISALAEQKRLLEEQIQKMQADFNSQLLVEHELRTKNDQMQNQMRQLEFINR